MMSCTQFSDYFGWFLSETRLGRVKDDIVFPLRRGMG